MLLSDEASALLASVGWFLNHSFSPCTYRFWDRRYRSHILSSSCPVIGKCPFRKSLFAQKLAMSFSLIYPCSQGNATSRVLVTHFTEAMWSVNRRQGSFPEENEGGMVTRKQANTFWWGNKTKQNKTCSHKYFCFPSVENLGYKSRRNLTVSTAPISRNIFY